MVAQWWHGEWGHERGLSVETICDDLSSKLNLATLPVHVLALSEGRPLGVGALKRHEMRDVFPERSPWLGSLFVAPGHRGHGIGGKLVSELERIARERGFRQLYLQTEQLDGGIYARAGWRRLEELDYRGYRALTMAKEL